MGYQTNREIEEQLVDSVGITVSFWYNTNANKSLVDFPINVHSLHFPLKAIVILNDHVYSAMRLRVANNGSLQCEMSASFPSETFHSSVQEMATQSCINLGNIMTIQIDCND